MPEGEPGAEVRARSAVGPLCRRARGGSGGAGRKSLARNPDARVEEKRLLSREDGAALVTVLVAIIVLLPPTILLATLALRWQRQSIDYRDRIAQEFAAEGVL